MDIASQYERIAAPQQQQATKPATTEAVTQTPAPVPATTSAATTLTENPHARNYTEAATSTDSLPTRGYAEAVTSTTTPTPGIALPSNTKRKDKGKQPTTGSNETPTPVKKQEAQQVFAQVHPDRVALITPPERTSVTPTHTLERTPPPQGPPAQARTIVLHGASTKYKPGQRRRWVEEDNKDIAVLGIRWLLQEPRRAGKAASSLVIYLGKPINISKGVRMERRTFRTTQYDWER